MVLYENIRLSRDDLSSLMCDNAEAVAKIVDLCRKNCPIDVLLWEISDVSKIDDLTWDELKQFISDVKPLGFLAEVAVAGDILPTAITRPDAPTGLGCGSGNVWITPIGETYTIRFYVNGIYKLTMSNYNTTDLATLGAVSGDIIQCCEIVSGIAGWFARITVP